MQKEIEGMRAEMNMKINEMIAAINKLKFEHQPVVNQQVKTDEARRPEIKESKDANEEKAGHQDSDMQRANKQTETNNEGEGQDKVSA